MTEIRKRQLSHLGDFTTRPRVLVVTALALPVGAMGALAAWVLLRLIGLITHLVFFGEWSTSLASPGQGHAAWWIILFVPIVGGLIVGLMAKYGSEQIRGHGMPEAIESILNGGSRVQPRVAALKPVSAAISIGSGGPFGAEGPIIMTGGALGSLLAQMLRLSADERKTLLVSGAAAGMAATFNSPLAAIMLAVEMLLFEWRPRSFVPVVGAVSVATVLRGVLIGSAPVFPVHAAGLHVSGGVDALCAVVGLSGGLIAAGATWLVYRAEDTFEKLPIHWMWWPAIGGAIIGLGGLVEPHALGVGYDVIDSLLTGRATLSLIIGILVVKTLIWSLSLGSGTSGGVLAPVFMIGGALGALEGYALPGVIPGFWAMMGLASVVGGVMRSPLTGVIFTLELTHVWGAVLPLAIASTAAFTLSVLILKRSVLTEKISRHGRHLTREYSIDPLEAFFTDEVMIRTPLILHATQRLDEELLTRVRADDSPDRGQRLYPVVDEAGELIGVTSRGVLLAQAAPLETGDAPETPPTVAEGMTTPRAVVRRDDTLRTVSYEFAEQGVTRAPVVESAPSLRVVGVITLPALLQARLHDLTEEHERKRILPKPPEQRLRDRVAARSTGRTSAVPAPATPEPAE